MSGRQPVGHRGGGFRAARPCSTPIRTGNHVPLSSRSPPVVGWNHATGFEPDGHRGGRCSTQPLEAALGPDHQGRRALTAGDVDRLLKHTADLASRRPRRREELALESIQLRVLPVLPARLRRGQRLLQEIEAFVDLSCTSAHLGEQRQVVGPPYSRTRSRVWLQGPRASARFRARPVRAWAPPLGSSPVPTNPTMPSSLLNTRTPFGLTAQSPCVGWDIGHGV